MWMPGSKSHHRQQRDARVSLWQLTLDGGARKRISNDINPGSFWIDASVGRDGALASPAITKPSVELYYMTSPTAKPSD